MDHELYVDFATAAELRGLRPSSLVHQFAVHVIRDEQLRNPALFTLKRAEVKQRILKNSASKRKKKSRLTVVRVEEPEEAA